MASPSRLSLGKGGARQVSACGRSRTKGARSLGAAVSCGLAVSGAGRRDAALGPKGDSAGRNETETRSGSTAATTTGRDCRFLGRMGVRRLASRRKASTAGLAASAVDCRAEKSRS